MNSVRKERLLAITCNFPAALHVLKHQFTCVNMRQPVFILPTCGVCANVKEGCSSSSARAEETRRQDFLCDRETRGCREITQSQYVVQSCQSGPIAAEESQGWSANQKLTLPQPSDLYQTYSRRDLITTKRPVANTPITKRHFRNRDACFLEHDQRVLSPYMNQHQISSQKETKNLLF